MKTYKHYFNQLPHIPEVQPIIKYYAYKDGVAGCFDTWEAAYKQSKLVEKIIANKDEVNQYKEKLKQAELLAHENWLNDLQVEFQQEYPKLFAYSHETFQAIYEKAYGRGHSCGYDEVYNIFISEADYLHEIFEKLNII